MATIVDVAKKAGVSCQTVSRVINNSTNVSEKTRKKVLEVINELDFCPNDLARALKTSKSKTVGFIISDPNNPFYINIAISLQHKLDECGYSLVILFSNEDPDNQDKCFEYMFQKCVDMILFTPTSPTAHLAERLKSRNVRAIQLFRNIVNDVNYIVADDEYGTYKATKYLLENHHEKMMLIVGPYETENNRKRGFIRALKEFKIEFNDNMFVELTGNDEQQETALSKKIKEYKPTAMIPVSMPVEQITLQVLKKNDITIGKDVSVIFYDDNEIAKLLNITCIAHDIEEISEIIKNHLLNDVDVDLKVAPFLKIRDSVKNI